MKLKTLYSFFCAKFIHLTNVKAKIKTLCLLSVFLLTLVVLFFGCNVTPVPQVQNTNNNEDTKTTTKKRSTRSTTSARISCKDEGSGDCDKTCKKTCDSMFSRSDDEKECQKYSESLVEDMDDLLDDLGRGKNTDSLDITALQCILNLDDEPVIDAIEDMSSGSAKKFLEHIAQDEELAEALSDEDEDLDIIKAIFKEAAGGSTSLKRHLSIAIDDGKSFLWLVAEESNEPAWSWLEDYVGEECDDGDSDCPGGENIGAYCNALLEESDGDLNNFLDDADLFADEYENDVEGDVEGDKYVYEVTNSVSSGKNGDFRAWCEVQKQGGASCPPDGREPASSNRLAAITFALSSTHYFYRIATGYCFAPGHRDRNGIGTSEPNSQNIILELSDYSNHNGELLLDKSKISYSSGKTYYLYIDNDRYELPGGSDKTEYQESSCSFGTTRNVIFWKNFLESGDEFNSGSSYDVYIASEENGVCEFYKP